jgi:hypothetical protein
MNKQIDINILMEILQTSKIKDLENILKILQYSIQYLNQNLKSEKLLKL